MIEACRDLIGLEIECEESMYQNFKIEAQTIDVLKYFMPTRYQGQNWHMVCGIYLGMGMHVNLYYNGLGKLIKVFGILNEKSTVIDMYRFDLQTRKIVKEKPHPVIDAILMGKYIVIREMLHRGMDPNINTEYGSALTMAIKQKKLRIAREFIKWGADTEGMIELAVETRNVQAIKLLVEMGCDITIELLELAMSKLNL